MKEENNKKVDSAPNDYLSKSFFEELNYKMWSTKGSRFNCDKRLRTKGKTSNVGLAIISAYLIIASLITVFGLELGISQNALNFIITGLSILVLVFSQFENAQNYELNAKMHHDSGLKISELYNELRIFKTLKQDPSNYEILSFAKDITKKYESVLNTSGNHSRIDYDRFLMTNIEYMKRTNPDKVKNLNKNEIKVRYYWNVYGWHFLLIIIPPITFVLMSIYSQ
ncbi:SLATT domain-containing protein [Winogradskyella forsetii]|uniref:SLATT domain-containing protein n=1 Tax=Winogradskyella forsetii TaxID=2686077 RepID=UPI0015BB1DD8|nr:SLATT domain-containing protein [Winogradskyella forsetii]